ncbi:hypothetical protein [Desulfosediminicola ganghwensis]|nr:hypothetical protein [Desulfosediminicola ganghwensis]
MIEVMALSSAAVVSGYVKRQHQVISASTLVLPWSAMADPELLCNQSS